MINKEIELKLIFKLFQEENIDYIVLRGFNEIPNAITYKNDLDLLCKKYDSDKIYNIFKKLRYEFYQDSLKNNIYLYQALPHHHFRSKEKDLHIDIVYNLSYRSPNKGEWVSIHEELQQSIWNTKRIVNDFWNYQASYIDEFIHLICHSIFDKQEFKLKHIQRLNKLFSLIEMDDVVEKLKLVFFKYTPYLLKQIEQQKYDDILKNYLEFKEY